MIEVPLLDLKAQYAGIHCSLISIRKPSSSMPKP
jgi:hypothetical protein